MSETRFTPGPWIISGMSINDGSISIAYEAHRAVIALVTNAASLGDFMAASIKGCTDFGAPDTAVTQWANARLISAAPDLYAALDALCRWIDRSNIHPPGLYNAGILALEKARGEQP